ncbi:hypothetical protein DFH06DRAFT_1276631 [Mycena polygramma]|nr:hypothetical protein DFH06DRAFT_1276631 [Mycena polygramma]
MALLDSLARDPVLATLTFHQVTTFIRLLSLLKNDIILVQPYYIKTTEAPLVLPTNITSFVAQAIGIDPDSVAGCWRVLKEEVWQHPSPEEVTEAEELFFTQYGWTALSLYPPSHECQNLHCGRTNPLKKAECRQVVVYTLDKGVRPAWSIHLYCEDCKTNYQHEFSVNQGVRTYYGGIPKYIQVEEHQFVERKLVGMWISLMLLAWVLATNCARSYDMALSENQHQDLQEAGWQFGTRLTTDHVWDAFTILTLLEYHVRKNTCLAVPHTGEQKDRYTAAMCARNLEVIEQGQDEIGHCCDKCMRENWVDPTTGETRDIQGVITDGLAIGFHRCQATHCTEELANNRHRFCPQHFQLHEVCAIVGCNAPVRQDAKTCNAREHAEIERLHYERGQAAFTLRNRLQRHRLAHPLNGLDEGQADTLDAIDTADDIETFDVDDDGNVRIHSNDNPGSVGVTDEACAASKSPAGNRKYKALLGRSRTHNLQSACRPCGVVVAQAPFYNAEAVSNVLYFIEKVFSVPRAHKPEHLIYDTNCDAKQQVLAHPEHWSWFQDVAMTVDVFHFLHKHEEGHTFCQEHCNPAAYPELLGPDNKWFFNTSVAEQINVWLGGYQSMCREMLPTKFNFFLNEMIRLRNQITVAKLAADGHNPRERVRRM